MGPRAAAIKAAIADPAVVKVVLGRLTEKDGRPGPGPLGKIPLMLHPQLPDRTVWVRELTDRDHHACNRLIPR